MSRSPAAREAETFEAFEADATPPARVNHWVWVVGPGTPPGPARCCAPATRRGDLAVLYRSRRTKDVAYLLRATSDAYRDGDATRCDVEVLEEFAEPVPIAVLRDDPVTATWPALRASFVRRVWPVPDDVWARLMELAGSAHQPHRNRQRRAPRSVRA